MKPEEDAEDSSPAAVVLPLDLADCFLSLTSRGLDLPRAVEGFKTSALKEGCEVVSVEELIGDWRCIAAGDIDVRENWEE